MNWRIESFTELEHLALEDRKRLVRQCFGRTGFLRMMILPVLVGGGCGAWLGLMMFDFLGIPRPWFDILVGGAVLAGALLGYQFELIRIRGQLLIHLEEMAGTQKLPMCLRCGYNLEGLQSKTCPECGFRLGAGSARTGNREM